MRTISRILAATDFSLAGHSALARAEPADLDARLLDLGSSVAKLFKGSLHVLHAYTPLVNLVPLPAAVPIAPPPEAEEAHAELVANELARLAKSVGVPPRAQLDRL